MPTFNFPIDAVGTEGLRSTNTVPGTANPASPVLDTPRIYPEHSTTVRTIVPRKDRRSNDRRMRDRRKQDLSVLLDTRSQHDRRTSSRRHQDGHSSGKKFARTRGINIVI